MKRSSSLFLTWTLGLAAIAALAGVARAQDASPQPASLQAALVAPADNEADGRATGTKATPVLGEIAIESVPAQKVLIRQIQGGYDKHQEVFFDLKTTVTQLTQAASKGAPGVKLAVAADCLGLYAFDPDTVTTDRLTWSAAVYVPESFALPTTTKAKALSVPASDYKVDTLPAIQAAVMYSTIGRAPTDGLKFFSWMADNGYVQIGPTRMVYFTDPQFDLLRATPEQIKESPTKIIVPVQKRERAIALKKGKAQ